MARSKNKHRSNKDFMLHLRTVQPKVEFQFLIDHVRNKSFQRKSVAGAFVGRPMQVMSRVAKRDHTYVNTFRRVTGVSSAKEHATRVGLALPVPMEILHGNGRGQVGPMADSTRENLAVATHGANTQMIPYDAAISGNTQITSATTFSLFKGTQVADTIHQNFYHANFASGKQPFFSQTIVGDRSPVTQDEYRGHLDRANDLRQYIASIQTKTSPFQ